MKTFCQACGGSIEYTSTRPNFCPHCGTGMNSGVASAPIARHPTEFAPRPRIPQRRPVTPVYQEEYYDDDIYVAPDEISVGLKRNAPKSVKAEHVVGTGATGFDRPKTKLKAKDFKALQAKMHETKPAPIEID